MVVAVDQPGHRHAVAGVEDLVGGGRLTGADLDDEAVAGAQPAARDLGARAGDEQPGSDDHSVVSSSAARWTASKMRT